MPTNPPVWDSETTLLVFLSEKAEVIQFVTRRLRMEAADGNVFTAGEAGLPSNKSVVSFLLSHLYIMRFILELCQFELLLGLDSIQTPSQFIFCITHTRKRNVALPLAY